MTLIDKISRLLLAPPATGFRAPLYGIALVAIPTLIRGLVDHLVVGAAFTSYIPFILLAAMFLTRTYPVGVALASALLADYLFAGPPRQLMESPDDLFGLSVFLISSILIIALVEAVRTVVDNSLRPTRPGEFSAPVVFSLEEGQAWASWYGSHSWVRLGPEDDVAEMMRDFLAQRELAKRLESSAKPSVNP